MKLFMPEVDFIFLKRFGYRNFLVTSRLLVKALQYAGFEDFISLSKRIQVTN